MNGNFKKLNFFTFGPKQCLYLTHSAEKHFEKLAFKKKHPNLNGCFSKARLNSELKLISSESLFNFFQNSVVFCTLQPHGYTSGRSTPYNLRCRWQWLAGLKELMITSKSFEFAPFWLIPLEAKRNFRKTAFFHFWTKVMLLPNPIGTEILWKICI